jgi:hypothetical protein
MPVNKRMCATCPWRENSPHADLVPILEDCAFSQASRICHSTGSNAINENTGKREKLCRGARNAQLHFLVAIRFLDEPTDAAWTAKCREMNIEQDRA